MEILEKHKFSKLFRASFSPYYVTYRETMFRIQPWPTDFHFIKILEEKLSGFSRKNLCCVFFSPL